MLIFKQFGQFYQNLQSNTCHFICFLLRSEMTDRLLIHILHNYILRSITYPGFVVQALTVFEISHRKHQKKLNEISQMSN